MQLHGVFSGHKNHLKVIHKREIDGIEDRISGGVVESPRSRHPVPVSSRLVGAGVFKPLYR